MICHYKCTLLDISVYTLCLYPRQPLLMYWGSGIMLVTALAEYLTHWGRVTHICVSKLTIIASDNGLSPGRRQAIIWTNAGILLIGTLGTNFSEILIEILTFSFTKMRLKVSSAKRRPSCLGLNELKVSSSLYLVWGLMLHKLQPVYYHVSLLSTVASQKENPSRLQATYQWQMIPKTQWK